MTTKQPNSEDFNYFANLLGIKFDDDKYSKKPHPQQKHINEIDNILKKYGSKK
jgi:hypothetical protein